jgi:quercetin dioxygenase-like cupin family protein
MRRCIFLFLTVLAFAQSAPEVEITAEPHHHFTFSNDQVRVFNVEVPPHSETLMHWHRHDYVYVTLGAAEVVNAVKGKDPITIKLADGETRFTPAAFAHIARNLSDQPFRNITIELLQDDKLRHSPPKWKEDRGLNILHGGTEEILWVHDNVRASLFELQPGGEAAISASSQLLIPVTDLHLISKSPPNAPHRMSTDVYRKSGEALWIAAHTSRTLTNRTTAVARFVTLEFP